MTDRRAAQAVGLHPDTAAYTESKPIVLAYMLEHRAAVQQQLVEQEIQALQRLNLDREQFLARLWEIANLSPEMTRGSITGQVKAPSILKGTAFIVCVRSEGKTQISPLRCAPVEMTKLLLCSGRFSMENQVHYRSNFVVSTGAHPDFLLRAASDGHLCGSP